MSTKFIVVDWEEDTVVGGGATIKEALNDAENHYDHNSDKVVNGAYEVYQNVSGEVIQGSLSFVPDTIPKKK